jgi:hypothetical protein
MVSQDKKGRTKMPNQQTITDLTTLQNTNAGITTISFKARLALNAACGQLGFGIGGNESRKVSAQYTAALTQAIGTENSR